MIVKKSYIPEIFIMATNESEFQITAKTVYLDFSFTSVKKSARSEENAILNLTRQRESATHKSYG